MAMGSISALALMSATKRRTRPQASDGMLLMLTGAVSRLFIAILGLFMASLAWTSVPDSTASAQAVDKLEFPVFGFAQTTGRSDCLVYGGHNIAFLISSAESVEPVVEFGDISIVGCHQFDNGDLGIAGIEDVEYGVVGRWSPTDRDWVWKRNDVELPITQMVANEDHLLCGDEQGSLSKLDAATGITRWGSVLHSKMVTGLTILDRRLAASADLTGKIVIFEQDTGVETASFAQHRDAVVGLRAFPVRELLQSNDSGDQRERSSPLKMVSAGSDGTVRFWYPQQRRMVRFIQLPSAAVALGPVDDVHVVVATDQGRLYWCDLQRAAVTAEIDLSDHTMASGERAYDSVALELRYPAAMIELDQQALLVGTRSGYMRRIRIPDSVDGGQ